MKILEIDDNLDIIKFVEIIATSMGHEFEFANNGRDGIKMIEENDYDMLLLDLSMPEFSGIDVLEELAAKGLTKKQKIVVFTASAQLRTTTDELTKKGAHSYIIKPIDIDELMNRFNEIESS